MKARCYIASMLSPCQPLLQSAAKDCHQAVLPQGTDKNVVHANRRRLGSKAFKSLHSSLLLAPILHQGAWLPTLEPFQPPSSAFSMSPPTGVCVVLTHRQTRAMAAALSKTCFLSEGGLKGIVLNHHSRGSDAMSPRAGSTGPCLEKSGIKS